MAQRNDDRTESVIASSKTAMIMLGLGLLLIITLAVIDRPHWFHLRPASGTAAAMSYASQPPEQSAQGR